eukprot:CAMPEP_0196729336 /NCGR_PEP_ID=MMETSP1091-20130531/9764_1 /TAXON_ID=302021 /ORGANISM="Rhodomonas sp., Strain CCMP768" /LENGTH=41 /DNA_ID= /DNA_START= /DNA_END= /DNA_ORIENTATION=
MGHLFAGSGGEHCGHSTCKSNREEVGTKSKKLASGGGRAGG